MKVVIVGGSIAGLMHGVMLKHHGHEVHILERVTRDLEAQGAGMSTYDEVKVFLAMHDRVERPLSLPAAGIRVYDKDTKLKQTIHAPAQMTTWDAMYYRLRANFDGLASKHCPDPPADRESDGKAIYSVGMEVTGIEARGPYQPVAVTYTNKSSGQPTEPIEADFVIGADGAASRVKSMLAPNAPQRKYSGYVAWRGIVPESKVSADARRLMSGWFTFHTASNQYVVVYPVPGRDGSLADGERGLNFVWYSWQSDEALKDILTDTDGHTHRWSVPSGKLRPELWESQKAIGLSSFTRELGEMLQATQNPFVQAISDYPAPSSPGPSFSGSRIILVGDAQCLLRPHTGFALCQTAKHCLELENRIHEVEAAVSDAHTLDDLDAIDKWSQTVLDFGHIARLRSIAIGMRFLKSGLGWLPAVLKWKFAELMQSIKTKMPSLNFDSGRTKTAISYAT